MRTVSSPTHLVACSMSLLVAVVEAIISISDFSDPPIFGCFDEQTSAEMFCLAAKTCMGYLVEYWRPRNAQRAM